MGRYKPNLAAQAEILTMPGVRRELKRQATRLAERAGDGYEARETPGRVKRARSVVLTASTDARVDNARHHTLNRLQ